MVATLQCGGNRRGGLDAHKRTSGNSWGAGAISNAKWGGVYLRDVQTLALALALTLTPI